MSDPNPNGAGDTAVPLDQFTHFGGFDWARGEHQLVVVDRAGQIVLSLRFANGSLPGAGGKIAPRLLSELGSNRMVFHDAQALQNYAGTSPVTKQSGRSRIVGLRRACNKTLRATIHLWADLSRRTSVWAEAYYQKKRADGLSHAAALRCLGNRWTKILWKMWQTGKPYDEALHLKNQTKHGSWVVKLLPETPAAKPA